MNVYPIYLSRLEEKKTIIIGGNDEAERKVKELLEVGANLTVISPELTGDLRQLVEERAFEWVPRWYNQELNDLEGAFMVIVADFINDINAQVYREAEHRGILVNVMDDIPHCNFSFGSMVKRGKLTISISSSGAAPTLAVRIRQQFEEMFGEEYEPFLEFMQQLREPMARHYPEFGTRRKLWYQLVDSGVVQLFREERYEDAAVLASSILGHEVVNGILESAGEEME